MKLRNSLKAVVGVFVVAALLSVTGVLQAANVTVKNFFAQCSGAQCDNKLTIGGTLDMFTGTIKVPFGGAGTATTAGSVLAGITDISNAASGTTQSTEYVLNSVTIPAKAFNVNGRALRCEAWAQTAANANAKNIKFYFGATAVVTVTGSTASGKDVHAELNVIRLAAASQTAQSLIQIDTATSPSMAVAAPTEDDTAAIVVSVKSANTAAAAASATGKGLSCYFIN